MHVCSISYLVLQETSFKSREHAGVNGERAFNEALILNARPS